MNKPSISIIGPGRLGNTLSVVFENSGYSVEHMYAKGEKIEALSDYTFITTPDSEIVKVVSELALSFQSLQGKQIFHCSGTLSYSILNELSKLGAVTACFHPLQAVTSRTSSFAETYFDLEGEEEALDTLEKLVKDLGAKSMRVNSKEKELLHLSAVMASNYLVTLMDVALQVSGESNISQRTLMDALLPLMKSSLENLNKLSPSEALTGPIARGDIQTVQKHIKLLENEVDLLNMYKKLGLLTLELIGNDLKDNTIKFRLYDALK